MEDDNRDESLRESLLENVEDHTIESSSNKSDFSNKFCSPFVLDELKKICSLSWPVALATLCRLAIISTDAAFIGHIPFKGKSRRLRTVRKPQDDNPYVTAVSLASTFGDFVSVLVWSPAYVLNSLCSQAIGADNPKLAGVWLQLALFICTVISALVIGCYFVTSEAVGIMNNSTEIRHDAQEYNNYAWLILWPTVMYMALRQFFQAIQIVKPAFVVSTLTIGFNLLMNQVLVFGLKDLIGLGEWSGLGFIGSPLATFSSMIFQISLFSWYVFYYKGYHKPYWNGWSTDCFSRSHVTTFLKVTLPMTIGSAVESWGFQLITFFSGSDAIGEDATSAMYFLYSIWGILWSFYWGWGLALQVRMGQHLGEGNDKAAKLVVTLSACIVVFVCFVVILGCLALRNELPKIFTDNEEVISIMSSTMPFLCVDFLAGCSVLCATNILEGMSRNTVMSVVNSTGTWFITVPLSLLFAFKVDYFTESDVPGARIHGLWCGSIVGQTCQSAILWYIIYNTDWKEMARQARERSEASTDTNAAESGEVLPITDDVEVAAASPLLARRSPAISARASPRVD